MQSVGKLRDRYNAVHNESSLGNYNPHEDRLAELGEELEVAMRAESPLSTREGIQREREWAKGQNWGDLQKAQKACLARGYSLADLQSAIKTLIADLEK